MAWRVRGLRENRLRPPSSLALRSDVATRWRPQSRGRHHHVSCLNRIPIAPFVARGSVFGNLVMDVARVNFRPVIRCAPGAFLVIALNGMSHQSVFGQSRSETLDLGPIHVAGDEASYLDLGAGAFDIQGHHEFPTSAEGRVEFRYGKKLFCIGPAIGVLANTQGGIFGYGGIYADFKFGQVVVTPLIAVGGYHRGGGEDLGATFLGRFSVAVSYELSNQSRIGLQFAHVSNAGTGRRNANPGENELLLTYAVPLKLP
jgi:lipid A 3-O-deacylase